MTDDLISRSAVLDSLQELLGQEVIGACYDISDVGVGIEMSMNQVKSSPTVDAVPVVHARFGFVGPDLSVYRYDTRYGTCSACKRRIVFIPSQTNYCPNCGAKMDEEEPK